MSCFQKKDIFSGVLKGLIRYLPVLDYTRIPTVFMLVKAFQSSRLREIVSKCTIFSFYLKFSRAVNLGVKETICKAWLGFAIIDWNVCLSLHSMMKVEHVAYE